MVPANPFALAVDVGTSSLKAVLYDHQGGLIGSATRRYTYRSDQPGWAEMDPAEWWAAFRSSVRDLNGQGFKLGSVEAIAFTGQMHSAVLLDANAEAVEPTVLWLDRRAAQETQELAAELSLRPYQINSTYTLPKLLWLKRHRPEVVSRVHTILWPKDYMRFLLTGEICTDLTEAGGAALLDWETKTWAVNRLPTAGLDESVLPPIRAAGEVIGRPLRDAAAELGLNPEASVIVGMGDVAALIGGAPLKPGRVVCSLGSSSMVFAALGPDQFPRDPGDRLYTYPFLSPYRLFGGVSSTTGAALVWAYDNFVRGASPAIDFPAAMRGAAQCEPGADGLCFIPYLAGERSPYWMDEIRAGFYGLRLSHDFRHILRAVMEGVAFSLRHLLDVYAECGVPVLELALAGGGTKTPGLCQIIADACGMDVSIYAEEETVTRVLYALCASVMGSSDFEDALIGTFNDPERVYCSREFAPQYAPAYASYRRFAAFAAEEAALVPSRPEKEQMAV